MTIQVTVVYSPAPREVREWPLRLPDGATLREAVTASDLVRACPELDLAAATVGIWGRRAAWNQVLRDNDRVEVYRGLRVDPKLARRERFRSQGARATGLFARKRAGGKSGY